MRIAKVIVALLIIYSAGKAAGTGGLLYAVSMKSLALALFPLVLYVLSFYDEKERTVAREFLRSLSPSTGSGYTGS